MEKLFFLILAMASLTSSASSLKFFVGEEIRKGNVGDKSYSLEVKLSEAEGVFKEFNLVIDDQIVPITDSNFYKLKNIDYDTLDLFIGRSSYATESQLIFGPFEDIEIRFNYYGSDSRKCAIYQARYKIRLEASEGKLTTSCFEGEPTK